MSEIRDQARLLDHLLEAVSDYAIYALDPDGRVVTWNAGAHALMGYTAAEIEGQPYAMFFTADARAAHEPQSILARAAAEDRVEIEGWRLRKDGSRFWSTGVVHAVRTQDGQLIGFAKVTRDMTERREVEHALIESERRFRLLVEGVTDYAIFMVDVNGMITNWNRGAERIKGWRAREVIGRHFSLFYTPEDRQAGLPARALETALKEGHFESDGWRTRKDGSRFWASVVIDPIHDDAGRLIGFAEITRDVSQKRAAEQALAESEQQFRLLVSGVVDYALFMLDPNGVVANWNAGAEHIKGYTAEEIVGQHFSRFYTEADRAAGLPMRALQAAIEHGRYESEGWRVRKDGSLFWGLAIIDAIRDENGRLVGFAKITRDMTERRNAQMELERARELLAQAQKMEAIGKLTGGVAHDFNNLLMVVSGQAQLLRARLGDDPRALRALDAIEAAAARGEDLTRHLLTFARRQRLQPVALALNERAPSLSQLLSASLPANITLVFDLPPDLWTALVDVNEFELAVLNLAVNARDAMPNGGRLILKARNLVLAEGAEGLNGEFVELTVSDTGAGIPADILPRIFEPFFTTKEIAKGTGLGLSQVFGFAKQSGGRVSVTSDLGAGATFKLVLPRATGVQPAASQSADTLIEPSPGARILLVEDNPEVAEVAAAMLEELGHRVRVVGNAKAALAAVAEDEPPDLVFSDIVMAGELDGVALARRLREEHPGLPVLLATGYSQAAERLGSEFSILRKPYQLTDLGRAVSALLSRGRDPDPTLVDLASERQARSRRKR